MSNKDIKQGYLLKAPDKGILRPKKVKEIQYHQASMAEYRWIQIRKKKWSISYNTGENTFMRDGWMKAKQAMMDHIQISQPSNP